MSHFYHVHFSQTRPDGLIVDGDATLILDQPLDYVSDVGLVKQLLNRESPGAGILVKSWQALKGPQRPPEGIHADAPSELRYSSALQALGEGQTATLIERLHQVRSAPDTVSANAVAAQAIEDLANFADCGLVPGEVVTWLRRLAIQMSCTRARLQRESAA